MTVAVKYCGGCNPRYDRRALVAALGERFPRASWVGSGAPCPDFVLVVCGCSSRCAEHGGLHGRYGKLILISEEDMAKAEDMLGAYFEKNQTRS